MRGPLAVIGRIINLEPIPGADRIELATVVCGSAGRWRGVVPKGGATEVAALVFLQDAILPEDDRWSFMAKHGWRVRMARFKGMPSECLIVPALGDEAGMPVGTDVTERLGVRKHEKPVPVGMAGEPVGPFPSFIPKTDEENFQRVPELVARMVEGWCASIKHDGTSCTAWVDADGLHVCSRNWELREFTADGTGNLYWRTARKYGLDRLPEGLALQFEVVGPGVQKNPAGLAEVEARAFKLHHVPTRAYLSVDSLHSVCSDIGIPVAEIVRHPTSEVLTDDELLAFAEGLTYQDGGPAEGVVISDPGGRWSFKVLNLAYKERS